MRIKKRKPAFISGLNELFRVMEPRKAQAIEMAEKAQRMRLVALTMCEHAKGMQGRYVWRG